MRYVVKRSLKTSRAGRLYVVEIGDAFFQTDVIVTFSRGEWRTPFPRGSEEAGHLVGVCHADMVDRAQLRYEKYER